MDMVIAAGIMCLKNGDMEREKRNILISDLIYKYFRGALKGDEADILDAWLEKPEHAEFFMELRQSGRLYEGLEEMKYLEVQPAWRQLKGRMKAVRRRRWLKRIVGMAAVVAIGLMCGWFWWGREQAEENMMPVAAVQPVERTGVTVWKQAEHTFYLADTVKKLILPAENKEEPAETIEYHELQTASGDRLEVQLGDGTRVWLNGGSELKYPSRFACDRREVILCGEAYFEVAKDTDRPFTVMTTAAEIQVLGTSFNVLAGNGEECVTTLVEGRVQVSDGGEHGVVLSPGQQAMQTGSGVWEVKEVDTRYYTAWKEGLFAFRECALRDILGSLARHYGVEFIFEDEALAALPYTTMIEQCGEVEEVLRILERVGDFRCVRIEGKRAFSVKRK